MGERCLALFTLQLEAMLKYSTASTLLRDKIKPKDHEGEKILQVLEPAQKDMNYAKTLNDACSRRKQRAMA